MSGDQLKTCQLPGGGPHHSSHAKQHSDSQTICRQGYGQSEIHLSREETDGEVGLRRGVCLGKHATAAQMRAKLKAVCPVCAITRALVKIPRDPAKRHAQEPGQMVHVDVWGPYPIEGFDGT